MKIEASNWHSKLCNKKKIIARQESILESHLKKFDETKSNVEGVTVASKYILLSNGPWNLIRNLIRVEWSPVGRFTFRLMDEWWGFWTEHFSFIVKGWGTRHYVTFMLFLGMANAYIMRTNMSVAIGEYRLCIIQSTQSTHAIDFPSASCHGEPHRYPSRAGACRQRMPRHWLWKSHWAPAGWRIRMVDEQAGLDPVVVLLRICFDAGA